MPLRSSCLAMCLLSGSLFGADNPFIGTWKLNIDKSKFSKGGEIKAMTMTFKDEGANVRRIAEGAYANGKPMMEGGPEGTSIPWDGQEHQVQAPAPVVAVTVKRISGHSLAATVKTDGKVTEQIRAVVSKDGKTLTSRDAGSTPDGIKFHSVEVFDKQP